MEVYIHIPFCEKKCAYCDFLSFPGDDKTKHTYTEALIKEIAARGDAGASGEGTAGGATEDVRDGADCSGRKTLRTVFIGGGTPSVLAAERIREIMDALRAHFPIATDAEISIEANPGTVDAEKLRAYREAGINRISFGCQSTHDGELKSLGRIHNFAQFEESYQLARAAGFSNINADLMFGIPGQTPASWEESLRRVASLSPEHISAYSLILEDETPLAKRLLSRADETGEFAALPGEDEERLMYERTPEVLAEYGYAQYEISNYAKPGYACRHNIGYWTGVEYLGLGLGAASYVSEAEDRYEKIYQKSPSPMICCEEAVTAGAFVRYRNTDRMEEYLRDSAVPAKLRREEEKLSLRDLEAEFMILGLRMTEGVSEKEFATRFGETAEEVFGDAIAKQLREGLLERHGKLRLTKRGQSLANLVMREYLP